MLKDDDQSFTIVCHDGEEVYVAADTAELLSERCEFFANVFRHEMVESKSRRLTKPDWTVATAKGFVELVTQEKVQSDNALDFLNLIDACEQMLCPVEIIPSGAVKTDSQVMDKESVIKLYEVTTSNHFEWELQTKQRLSSDTFYRFLEHNIAVSTEEDFHLRIIKKKPARESELFAMPNRIGLISFASPLYKESCWRICCDRLDFHSCFYEVYKSLCRENPADEVHRISHKEQMSLRAPTSDPGFVHSHLVDQVCNKTGVQGYNHQASSLGFYLDGSNHGSCPTFTGSFKQLKDTLNLLNEEAISTYQDRSSSKKYKRCSLRVTAPTHDTVSRLIAACHHCTDNPDSLGADFRGNAMYAIKTVRDMKILLTHLADGSKAVSSRDTGSFKLVELTYPKGVF
jgi:hypothetical protein